MTGILGKTIDVINSCKTEEQLKVASRYTGLYTKQLQRYSDTYNFIHEIFNLKAFKLDISLYKTIGRVF